MKVLKFIAPIALSLLMVACSTEEANTDALDGAQIEASHGDEGCADDCEKACCAKDAHKCSSEDKDACEKKCSSEKGHECTEACAEECSAEKEACEEGCEKACCAEKTACEEGCEKACCAEKA